MGAFALPNFRFGLDQRRHRIAGAVGTLWNLENAHLSRGCDVEGAKAFVPAFTLPTGCFGLTAVGSRLFVFGSADLAASMPPGVNYQRLIYGTAGMTGVLVSVAYNGSPYVIAQYDDGSIGHFYNGARVTDWDSIADANTNATVLADYLALLLGSASGVSATAYGSTILVTSLVAGNSDGVLVAMSAGASGTLATVVVQAAVPASPETVATGTITVTGGSFYPGTNTFSQVTVNGVNLLNKAVDWTLDNASTANLLAVEINNRSAVSGYTAAAAGAVVTVLAAPGLGAAPNGLTPIVASIGNATATTTAFAGGVSAVSAVAQVVSIVLGGAFVSTDSYYITINGTTFVSTGRAAGSGLTAFVLNSRIYSCANTHVAYCGVNEPTNWTDSAPSSGAGFINIASQANGAERLTGIEVYNSYCCIFSARNARLYSLTADATQVSIFQQMKNTGAIASRSLQSFAGTDLFYLGVVGIRTLKAKDTLGFAFASDAGAAVDSHMQAWMKSVGAGVARGAISVIEPLDQRYWLAIGSRIYVYSYFPATQIGAWSYYSPGFAVSSFAVIDDKLYCQSGNTIYLYGGATGQVYPGAGVTPITLETPFYSANDPEKSKMWTNIDIAATGIWQVTELVDPNDWTKTINGGLIVNATYSGPSTNVVGRSPLFALKLTCSSAGYRSFSAFSNSYLERNV